MSIVAERGVCFSAFLENDDMLGGFRIFSRKSVRTGILGRYVYYSVDDMSAALSTQDDLILVPDYKYDRDVEYRMAPILANLYPTYDLLSECLPDASDEDKRLLANKVKFILRYHGSGIPDCDWIAEKMDGSQILSKAVYGVDAEERVRRMVQVCGQVTTTDEFLDKINGRRDRYDVSIANVFVRLAVLDYDLIDVNFSRALFAERVNRDKLHDFLYITKYDEKCLLCSLCRNISFTAHFRIGTRVVKGNYIIGSGEHIRTASDFERAAGDICGVITDVGHVVSVRAVDKVPELEEDRSLTWSFRIFRSLLHSGAVNDEGQNLFLIMNSLQCGKKVTSLLLTVLWFTNKMMTDQNFLESDSSISAAEWLRLSRDIVSYRRYVEKRATAAGDSYSYIDEKVRTFSLELVQTTSREIA